MKRRTLFAALALLTAPVAATAHGPAPAAAHGGTIAETSNDYWVELVVRGDQFVAYVTDPDFKPVPSAQLGGKATVLAGGKREEVTLVAGDGNTLKGKLAATAAGKMRAVLALAIGGKPATVRFAVG